GSKPGSSGGVSVGGADRSGGSVICDISWGDCHPQAPADMDRERARVREVTMALIELRDVTKSYRRDTMDIPVLEGVSITVPEGDFLGLMGPSGSGKSTLLNLLAGIDRPTRGSVRIGDTEISRLPERALAGWRARHIGFIFQLYNLIPVLTAFENVE